MADRSLAGILLIALVGSSFLFLALTTGGGELLSVLEIQVPDSITYSDEEYHVVASVVANDDIAEVELRFHWLAAVGSEDLQRMRSAYGEGIGDDPSEGRGIFSPIREVWDRSNEMGLAPGILDIEVSVEGDPYRVVLFTFGGVQEGFMPARIGPGEGRRPVASGDYAMVINESGHLAAVYVGYPAFFYDVERTLLRLEIGLDGEKSSYENRTAESSLPRLRDIPLIGRLKLPLAEGERLDLLIAVEGRSIRLWRPGLCITEIHANGDLVDSRAFFT